MTDFESLPAFATDGHVHVVVESPRGSTMKLKYDSTLRAFVYGRALTLGASYPFDWGFVPSTRAEDGDPLDAMVLGDGPTWPGTVIPVLLVGVVRLSQVEKGRRTRVNNDRLIAVPAGAERFRRIRDLPRELIQELEAFFVVATAHTEKKVKIEGWSGAKVARQLLDRACAAYAQDE